MSFGKMSEQITILREEHTTDSEGFAQTRDVPLATVRAYFEQRHGNVKWANRAAFSEATHLFRFRVIPGVAVEPLYIIVCGLKRFEVLSTEVLRGQYCEALVKEMLPIGPVSPNAG
jgi:hypothetical protein